MNQGILLALAAAVSFGLSDTCAALMSRRIGALRAGTAALIVSLVALVLYAAVNPPAIPTDAAWLGRVFALGCLTGVAYLSLVNALRLGPVSVVSPLGATVGAVSVILAVLLLGSRPTALQWAAVAATATGSVLVALVPHAGRVRLTGRGPLFAVIALLGYAVSVVGLQDPIRAAGWLATLLVWRSGNVIVAGAIFLAARGRLADAVPAAPSGDDLAVLATAVDASPTRAGRRIRWDGRVALAGVAAAGLFETLGQVLRAQGLAVAPAWLVGLVGSIAPVIVIGAGVLVLKERLAPSQWLGIACVAAGILLLAVS